MKACICGILLTFCVYSVSADTNVAPITDSTLLVKNTIINSFYGIMLENGQKETYPFSVSRSGRYRFEVAELRGNARVQLSVLNHLGGIVKSTVCGNGYGLTIDGLTGNRDYQIQVEQFSGLSSFSIVMGHQKETIDVSGLTRVFDSVEYTDQMNTYSFIAPQSGRYRFEMAELRGNARVQLAVLNHLDEIIKTDYCSNGYGLTLDGLEKGRTYTIQITQYYGLSPYSLNVGRQKETVYIYGSDKINDSLQFNDQNNVYEFTAVSDGTYRFEMAELMNNARVYLAVLNTLGEIVGSSYCSNGYGLTLNEFVRGQTYQVQVQQVNGLGVYQLIIKRQ